MIGDGSHRCLFFFFNDTATTEIYTLSLHDALPIYQTNVSTARQGSQTACASPRPRAPEPRRGPAPHGTPDRKSTRLNSTQSNLVCRLLLEKKKKKVPTDSLRNPHGSGTSPNEWPYA